MENLNQDFELGVIVDEAVTIEELLLQNLSKRRDLISKQKEGMEVKMAVHERELDELCLAERSLDQAMIQHLTLQQELELQLRRTEEKLSRNNIFFPDDGSSDEKDTCEDKALENIATDETGGEPESGKKEIPLDEESNHRSLKETSPLSSLTLENRNDAEGANFDEEVLRAVNEAEMQGHTEYSDDEVTLDDDQLVPPPTKRRRVQPGPDIKLCTTHLQNPFITDKGGLSSSFLVARSDEAFLTFHKFLDGTQLTRLMNLITEDHASMDSQYNDGQHRREALSHSCVLPFQLLCNDENPEIVVNEGDQLDPDKPICPYELAGVCADPYCAFQHLKDRAVESKELVKEELTLPKLTLLQHTESYKKIEEEDQVSHQAKSENSSDESHETSEVKTLNSTETEDANLGTREERELESRFTVAPMNFDEDFVSLPVASESSEDLNEFQESEDSVLIEEPKTWWMSEGDKGRIENKMKQRPRHISIVDWIYLLCGIQVYDKNISFEIVNLDKQNITPFIFWLGRLSDAAKVAMHAGRYDIAHALLKSIQEKLCDINSSYPLKGLDQFYTNVVNHIFKKSVTQKLLPMVWLELQLLLCCVSEFLFLFQNQRTVINRKFWREVLNVLITTTTKRKASEDNTLIERIRDKYFHLNPAAISKILCLLKVCYRFEECSAATAEKSPTNAIVDQTKDVTRLRDVINTAEPRSFSERQQIILDVALSILDLAPNLAVATRALVTKLESALDLVCSSTNEFCDLQLQLLITPLISLRVSLLVALKRYDKAQNTLELYLNKNFSMYSLSDFLWSQMVMLRSNLKCSKSSDEIGNQGISDIISSYDVRLNFISFPGDRNLWKPFLGKDVTQDMKIRKSREWWNKLRVTIAFFVGKATTESPASEGSILTDLSLESLSLTTEQYPGNVIKLASLAFPRTLMHGGFLVRSLNLHGCQICTLPSIFGHHFPNLQVRRMICDF
mmetsp:Transcript_200/g.238  ORF Transcript_200/g.238 Transcript_200/m.238 type:complete len:965 (-) Transcript_200:355-3249(-)